MKQFRKFLLVLDPVAQQQPALERATKLARLHGASLHVLTVLDDLENTLVLTSSRGVPVEDRATATHPHRGMAGSAS